MDSLSYVGCMHGVVISVLFVVIGLHSSQEFVNFHDVQVKVLEQLVLLQHVQTDVEERTSYYKR